MRTFQKQNKLFWISLVACTFAKNVAMADTPKVEAVVIEKPQPQLISYSVAQELFANFDIEAISTGGFHFTGTYPRQCGGLRMVDDYKNSSNNRFGLQVSSPEVIDCLKKNKDSTDRANLSGLGTFHAKDGEVKFYWENIDQDVASSKRFDAKVVLADYKSPLTTSLEKNLELQGQNAERVTAILADIESGCSGDPDDIRRAQERLDELSTMDLVSARDVKNLRKALDDSMGVAELQAFHDRVAEAEYSDLKDIRKDLRKALRTKEMRRNKDAKSEAAVIFAEIIARYRDGNTLESIDGISERAQKNRKLVACGQIRDTVREAQSISGLSPETRYDLKNIQNETEVECVGELAKRGRMMNPSFDPAYYSLMNRLRQEEQFACNVVSNPMVGYDMGMDMNDGLNYMDLSTCSKAIEARQYAEALGGYADSADQQIQNQIKQRQEAVSKRMAQSSAPAGNSAGSLGLANWSSMTGMPQQSSVFR